MRINDELLEKAKRKAAEEGRTLTSLFEEALAVALSQQKPPQREQVRVPVSKASGGVLPGVDLNDSASLSDLMDGL